MRRAKTMFGGGVAVECRIEGTVKAGDADRWFHGGVGQCGNTVGFRCSQLGKQSLATAGLE